MCAGDCILPTEFMYDESPWLVGGALLLVLALATELGYRVGRGARAGHDALTRAQFISIQAAVLGLLSLLLGFTFSMAVSRFEYRKEMVV